MSDRCSSKTPRESALPDGRSSADAKSIRPATIALRPRGLETRRRAILANRSIELRGRQGGKAEDSPSGGQAAVEGSLQTPEGSAESPREVRPASKAEEQAFTGAGKPGTSMEVHFKLFGTDGVSLQSQELSKALKSRGWRVHACASDVPREAEGLRLPDLSYQSDDALALRRRVSQPPWHRMSKIRKQQRRASWRRSRSVPYGSAELSRLTSTHMTSAWCMSVT